MMCNASLPKQYYFQNGGSIMQLDMLYLNDYIQFYLFIMIIFISWFYLYILIYYIINVMDKYFFVTITDFNHSSTLETIWTIIPTIILIFIAIPGFSTLYQLDQVVNSDITVKCIGSQWYWTYHVYDFTYEQMMTICFDSYMIATDKLNTGDLRLLSVDNQLIVPGNKLIRFVVTSSDVIHSFSVPSLAIKIDAVPGRLNQISVNINRYGTFYGSCQEICGIQHAFMPIQITSVPYLNFITHNFLSDGF